MRFLMYLIDCITEGILRPDLWMCSSHLVFIAHLKKIENVLVAIQAIFNVYAFGPYF